MKNIKILLISAFVLIGCSPAFSQEARFDVKKMDRFFDALEANNRMMGAVTLTVGGNAIYRRFLGFRNLPNAEKLKIDRKTAFRIGSITKVYTAVMIWQLIEGKSWI